VDAAEEEEMEMGDSVGGSFRRGGGVFVEFSFGGFALGEFVAGEAVEVGFAGAVEYHCTFAGLWAEVATF
jgi:hypothetical protein